MTDLIALAAAIAMMLGIYAALFVVFVVVFGVLSWLRGDKP